MFIRNEIDSKKKQFFLYLFFGLMFCSCEPRLSGGLSLEAGHDTLEGTWQWMQFIVHSSLECPLGAGWQPCTGDFVPRGNPGHKVTLGISKRNSRSVLCDNPWV